MSKEIDALLRESDERRTSAGWLSDKELAHYYGVSRQTIWAWTRRGILPEPTKIGPGTTRWNSAEIK